MVQVEGSNIRQREKLSCDTVAMENSSKRGAGPFGMVLQSGLSHEKSAVGSYNPLLANP